MRQGQSTSKQSYYCTWTCPGYGLILDLLPIKQPCDVVAFCGSNEKASVLAEFYRALEPEKRHEQGSPRMFQ